MQTKIVHKEAFQCPVCEYLIPLLEWMGKDLDRTCPRCHRSKLTHFKKTTYPYMEYDEPLYDIPLMLRQMADRIESGEFNEAEALQAVFLLFDGSTHRLIGEHGWGKTYVDPVEICRGAADSIEEMSE